MVRVMGRAVREPTQTGGLTAAPPTGAEPNRKPLGVTLLAVAVILTLGLGILFAVRAVRSPDGLAAPAGALARTIFVTEERQTEPSFEPYASTIHMVRTGRDGPRVIRTVEALGAPDMAVSADGTRLYVVSGDGRRDELVAYDVATGEVEMTARLRPEGRLFRVSGWPIPCCPTMEGSPDGRWLFLLWVTPGDEGERTFFVTTFDTVEGRMLPEMIPFDECEPGTQALVPLPGVRRLAVVCGKSGDVRFVQASRTGSVAASASVEIPAVPDVRQLLYGPFDFADPAWAVASPDRRLLYVVRLNGHVSIVDLEQERLVGEARVGLGPDRHVGYGQVHLSGTGESMFLGLGPMGDGHDVSTATHVMEVDTSTWAELRTVPVGTRFLTFAVTPGAVEIYVASSPRGLLLLDMSSGRVTEVPGVGPKHEMLEVSG
jgi:DNA-binding beta-propeller fold protein YncE